MKEDAAAFDRLMAAFKLPKETAEQVAAREEAVTQATLGAAEVPLVVCVNALEVMQLAAEAASSGNLNAISDAGSAFALARAAFNGAAMNVQINLNGIPDCGRKSSLLAELSGLTSRVAGQENILRATMAERGGIRY